jgi:hypothetical protein
MTDPGWLTGGAQGAGVRGDPAGLAALVIRGYLELRRAARNLSLHVLHLLGASGRRGTSLSEGQEDVGFLLCRSKSLRRYCC